MTQSDVELLKTVGTRNCANHDDAAELVQIEHGGVVNWARRVIDEDIDTSGASDGDIFNEIV